MTFKRTLLIVFCIYMLFNNGMSQIGLPPISGAKSLSLGNIRTGFEGSDAFFNNQAGLASLDSWALSLNSERRFNIGDIQSISAGFASPIQQAGVLGLSIQSFGVEGYSEQKIGLAYARQLFDNLAIGGQFDMIQTRIDGFGTNSVFSFELGMQSDISEVFMVSAHVFSPIRVNTLENEYLPTNFRVGLRYHPSSKVFVFTEFEKDIDYRESIKFGVDYAILENFFLRAGFQSEATTISMGMAFHLKQGIKLDTGVSYHQFLGLTPSVGISYQNTKAD